MSVSVYMKKWLMRGGFVGFISPPPSPPLGLRLNLHLSIVLGLFAIFAFVRGKRHVNLYSLILMDQSEFSCLDNARTCLLTVIINKINIIMSKHKLLYTYSRNWKMVSCE